MKIVWDGRSFAPKTALPALAVGLAVLLLSCHNYINPGDPKTTNYQQFQTVATPAEVVPESPVNGTTILWLVFRCSACPAADAYELQVSASATEWSVPSSQSATSSNNRLTTMDLGLPQGSYYWRVRARNRSTQQWTDWSTPSSFTLSGVSATGIAPATGGTTTDTTPLLDWGDVTGSASYQVQMAATGTALTASTPIAATASQYEVASALAIGDVCYWRVRAVNADGVAGAWSATWSFTVAAPPPPHEAVNTALASHAVSLRVVPVVAKGATGTYNGMTLTAYALSEAEVTQGDYQLVRGSNPSYFTGTASKPVEQVTWFNAVQFCNALSTLCGLQPVYNETTWAADFTKNGFYLPTEAQWEYAAGGPNHYVWSLSSTFTASSYVFNASGTAAVKSKTANGYGLYDMSGNVWEWCHDWYGGSYPYTGQTDPNGPTSGSSRVRRGGGWYSTDSTYLRSDYRYDYTPSNSTYNLGFRVAVGGHGIW